MLHSAKWLVGVVLLVVGGLSWFALADARSQPDQTTSLVPIYSGLYPDNISWASNSDFLSFYGYIVGDGDRSWYQYDPQLDQLTHKGQIPPIYPVLTTEQESLLILATTSDGQTSKIFISPNQQFAIYASRYNEEVTQMSTWWLSIADFTAQTTSELPIFVSNPFGFADQFKVLWNTTSSAFVVAFLPAHAPIYPQFAYGSGYTSSLRNITTKEVAVFDIGTVGYLPRDVYDISSDGRLVLLKAEEFQKLAPDRYKPTQASKLVVWDSVDIAASYVVAVADDNIIGAAFHPSDERKILFINEVGLSQYDLKTDTMLNFGTNFNANWAEKVFFSPNGRWAAVFDLDLDSDHGEIFIFNVIRQLPAIGVTPTPIN